MNQKKLQQLHDRLETAAEGPSLLPHAEGEWLVRYENGSTGGRTLAR